MHIIINTKFKRKYRVYKIYRVCVLKTASNISSSRFFLNTKKKPYGFLFNDDDNNPTEVTGYTNTHTHNVYSSEPREFTCIHKKKKKLTIIFGRIILFIKFFLCFQKKKKNYFHSRNYLKQTDTLFYRFYFLN